MQSSRRSQLKIIIFFNCYIWKRLGVNFVFSLILGERPSRNLSVACVTCVSTRGISGGITMVVQSIK
ncbi:hypothetical protein LIPSTDRAFT_121310 [Lipomyces starkeyi NRRL Y-11557]|uniref:Uncharacterized protein n=1 Tax=Lipomyces starkeyi NRRL Y-11557 TaxID=675824 RepID=A0A1E3QEJ6_LIPST|nr:hypothetical protein LIPSTDRAFT_121310 [Lipomyces starkeyi NRRL Y-11557]